MRERLRGGPSDVGWGRDFADDEEEGEGESIEGKADVEDSGVSEGGDGSEIAVGSMKEMFLRVMVGGFTWEIRGGELTKERRNL